MDGYINLKRIIGVAIIVVSSLLFCTILSVIGVLVISPYHSVDAQIEDSYIVCIYNKDSTEIKRQYLGNSLSAINNMDLISSVEYGGTVYYNTGAKKYSSYTPVQKGGGTNVRYWYYYLTYYERAETYTITYNKNTTDTVTGMPSSQTKNKDVDLVLSPLVPKRTGYKFVNWYSGGKYYTAASIFKENKDTTLYAVWQKSICSYEITYGANGGTGTTSVGGTGQEGDVITLQSAASVGVSRSGYTFLYWYQYDINTPITSFTLPDPVTLEVDKYYVSVKARWGCTVSFSTSGGGYVSPTSITNVPVGSTVSQNGSSITINGTTVAATAYSSTDSYSYSFSSWTNVPEKITGAVTITANFSSSAHYIVEYNANGGTGSYETDYISRYSTHTIIDPLTNGFSKSGNITFISNINSGLDQALTKNYKINTPQWNTNANGTGTSYTAGDTISNRIGRLTLYLQWGNEVEDFTLPSIDATTYGYTSSQFLGWYDASGNRINTGSDCTLGSTYYAHWKNTLTVNYNVTWLDTVHPGSVEVTKGVTPEIGQEEYTLLKGTEITKTIDATNKNVVRISFTTLEGTGVEIKYEVKNSVGDPDLGHVLMFDLSGDALSLKGDSREMGGNYTLTCVAKEKTYTVVVKS